MATIVRGSAKVIEACEKVIEHIKAKREEEDRAALDRLLALKVKRWFGFGKTVSEYTREEAIQHLINCSFVYPSAYAWGDLDHARKLLTLARLGYPVTLNEEDCRVLF